MKMYNKVMRDKFLLEKKRADRFERKFNRMSKKYKKALNFGKDMINTIMELNIIATGKLQNVRNEKVEED